MENSDNSNLCIKLSASSVCIERIKQEMVYTLDRLPVYHRADTLTVKTDIQYSNLQAIWEGTRAARGNYSNTQSLIPVSLIHHFIPVRFLSDQTETWTMSFFKIDCGSLQCQ